MVITKILTDENNERIVKKLIFEDKKRITETVAYKYKDRIVICFSCQSGCPVGCVFCGTGKKFIGNLTTDEMCEQIEQSLLAIGGASNKKIQLMAMSMGEPSYNRDAVISVGRKYLNMGYYFFISTVGIRGVRFSELYKYKNFGLQISLHEVIESKRIVLLGKHKNLMSFSDIKNLSSDYSALSGNKTYFNLVVTREYNILDFNLLSEIVGDNHLTVSVLCNKDKAELPDMEMFNKFVGDVGLYVDNWSAFNPVGQDTVGGGCGQLLYVQEKLKGITQ